MTDGRHPFRAETVRWQGSVSSSASPGRGRSPSTTAESLPFFDQTVASTNAQGVDFEKLSNELEAGQERLGALRTHGLHGVLQLYPVRAGRIRPYGGAGFGYAAMRADFGWNWRRNGDPLAIMTGRGQPNFRRDPEESCRYGQQGRDPVQRSTCTRVVYVGGVDFTVSDRVSVGVRARRLQYPLVEVGPYVGETLRGHVPNVRLDGSEPVSAWSTPPATGVTEVGVVLKYHLRQPSR